jgi:hypothetical protein
LKACIARKTKQHDFPPKPKIVGEYYTHELEKLVNYADLSAALKEEGKSDNEFESNWALVKDWKEDSRYDAKIDKKRAGGLYSAITNNKHGVLAWLRKFW